MSREATAARVRFRAAGHDRPTVPLVVLGLEIADHDTGFEQVGPVVAVEALGAQPAVERLDVAVAPG